MVQDIVARRHWMEFLVVDDDGGVYVSEHRMAGAYLRLNTNPPTSLSLGERLKYLLSIGTYRCDRNSWTNKQLH